MSYSPVFFSPNSSGNAKATSSGYQNSTGSTIAMSYAVSVNASGQLTLTDVTNETSSESWIGLASEAIPNSATGQVIGDGRVTNIPSSWGFSVGDAVWVGSTPGTLTNIRPSIGVGSWASGDFVLFVGVVVQNEFNNLQQDIHLCRQIIGEL